MEPKKFFFKCKTIYIYSWGENLDPVKMTMKVILYFGMKDKVKMQLQ